MPEITVHNVESVASTEGKKKVFGDKSKHMFWAKMECGLVLSSLGDRQQTEGRDEGWLPLQVLQAFLALKSWSHALCPDHGRAQGQVRPAPVDPG